MKEQNANLEAQVASLQAQNAQLKEQFARYQNETNARLTALEQTNPQPQGQMPNALTLNNLPFWGIVGLLALLLVLRRP